MTREQLKKQFILATSEERVANFVKEYPDMNKEYFLNDILFFHKLLTGACMAGQRKYLADLEYKRGCKYSIKQLIDVSKSSGYQEEIFIMLEQAYLAGQNT